MWLNIIIASSNFVGLMGFFNYYDKELFFEGYCILFSIMSSFFYHLVETHKHNMHGIGYFDNLKIQKILINIDRVGAVLGSIITLKRIYLLQIPLDSIILIGIFAIISLVIPEMISGLYSSGKHESIIPILIKHTLNPHGYKINRQIEHIIYVICHCCWHFSVFQISNLVSLY